MLPTAAKATTRDADAVDADAAENGEGGDDADAAALDADAAETVKATTMLMLLTTANATTEMLLLSMLMLLTEPGGLRSPIYHCFGEGRKVEGAEHDKQQSSFTV